MPDPAAVQAMFARIARRYDLANRVLSAGLDIRWRRKLVAAVQRSRPGKILDLATGSGDVAFALARSLPDGVSIMGMDFCEPMLAVAAERQRRHPVPGSIAFVSGDALALPLPDGAVDAITIAFGFRNFADRARALREMRRVLRNPGGHLFILEFSQPSRRLRPAYYAYLRHVLPHLARLITGDRAAYEYLGATIGAFPARAELAAEIAAAGFAKVIATPISGGIVALHEAF